MKNLTRAGELNPEFGNGGAAELPMFNNLLDRHITDSLMQGDNIVAGAIVYSNDHIESPYFAMTRFTREGKLDTAFGDDGKVLGLFSDSNHSGCEAVSTADDDNGSIWMLGWFKRFQTDLEHIGLLRFDRDAKASTEHALEQPDNTRLIERCSTLNILGSSVMATANFTEIDGTPSHSRVYRLSLQGGPGFGEKQYIDISYAQGPIHITTLVQQPHAFVIAGQLRKADNNDYGFIARYLTNGALDPTFANGAGIYSFLADGADTRIKQLILRPDGTLLAIGEAKRPALARVDAMVVQLTADGSVDPAFNQGLPVFMNFKDDFSTYSSGALHANAQLTVAGRSFDGDLFSVRYNADGTQDTSFSLKEPLTTDVALITLVRADDTLIATSAMGPTGPTGMIFSFLNQ